MSRAEVTSPRLGSIREGERSAQIGCAPRPSRVGWDELEFGEGRGLGLLNLSRWLGCGLRDDVEAAFGDHIGV